MKYKNRKVLFCIAVIIILIIAPLITFNISHSSGKDIKDIGFIILGSTDENGWNGLNYQGAMNACENRGVNLVVKENILEGTGDCEKAAKELIDSGIKIIILTSYNYADEIKEIIQNTPDVSFYCTSASFTSDNLTVYMGRMYQARYLSGIVAGQTTKTNNIGYVAAMPNNEVNRGISAFALGVRSVNQDAKIHVVFTNSWNDKDKETELVNSLISDCGIDLVTYHQDQTNVIDAAEEAGIYSIGYHIFSDDKSENYLTSVVWDFEKLYDCIISEFLQDKANTSNILWYGIDSGVVGLSSFSPIVSEETKKTVEAVKESIIAKKDVFSGTIYDNNGNLRCSDGETISDEQLLNHFDWYAEGVEIYAG